MSEGQIEVDRMPGYVEDTAGLSFGPVGCGNYGSGYSPDPNVISPKRVLDFLEGDRVFAAGMGLAGIVGDVGSDFLSSCNFEINPDFNRGI